MSNLKAVKIEQSHITFVWFFSYKSKLPRKSLTRNENFSVLVANEPNQNLRTGTRKDLQVCFESPRRTLVGQNYVGESVRQRSAANIRVDRQRFRGGFKPRIRTQSVEGRNMGPNTGVWRELSSESRPSVFAAVVAPKHIAEEIPLFVVNRSFSEQSQKARDYSNVLMRTVAFWFG